MTTHIFHVSGIHCKACAMLIEGELADLPNVSTARVSSRHHTVEVTGAFNTNDQAEIMQLLEAPLVRHGYRLGLEKTTHSRAWGQFAVAVPIAVLFLGAFALLQQAGIVNLLTVSKVNYATAFAIGIIASLSTCMAIVGGLTLSISANFAKEGSRTLPQLLFHAGRLVSFFLLGGMMGAIGAEFQPGQQGMLVLNIIVGLVMLLLGINLLDIFHVFKKLQPTLPKFISGRMLALKEVNHVLTPALLGVVTFFLPCGFTQSMQLYALSSGQFWEGALTMLSFAIGTLPVLAVLSFASLGTHTRRTSGIFFKTAGLVVIAFALFNLLNAFVAAGYIKPLIRI